jgi:hypothetical protein
VGDYNLPNPAEAQAAGRFLANTAAQLHRKHYMLALPSGSQHARRFLRTLCGIAPLDTHNLVVITGDYISLNHVFRDRDLAWNVLDIPLPLVFFSHRNPISERAGFDRTGTNAEALTGTQDLLLNVDVFQALLQAAFHKGRFLADPEGLPANLRETRWYHGEAFNPGFTDIPAGAVPLFNAEGDRNKHTGEHVVWLRPQFADNQVLMQATITVWRIPGDDPQGSWRLAGPPLSITYNTLKSQGFAAHAAD